jgi:hypothetical protein
VVRNRGPYLSPAMPGSRDVLFNEDFEPVVTGSFVFEQVVERRENFGYLRLTPCQAEDRAARSKEIRHSTETSVAIPTRAVQAHLPSAT